MTAKNLTCKLRSQVKTDFLLPLHKQLPLYKKPQAYSTKPQNSCQSQLDGKRFSEFPTHDIILIHHTRDSGTSEERFLWRKMQFIVLK